MCAPLTAHRLACCRAAGNIHDGGQGMGVRRKGEELGTSAIRRKTLSRTGIVEGRASWSSVSDLRQQASGWKHETSRPRKSTSMTEGKAEYDGGYGKTVISQRSATANHSLET
jgi:hypothetical protein